MKTVILAGGLGTRLAEETSVKPKPMVEIGGKPILEHIMGIYAKHGAKDFIVASGYKGDVITRYFLDYSNLGRDLEIDFKNGQTRCYEKNLLDWKVRIVDTGQNTLTGGRVARLAPILKDQGTFMLTYGDGLADIDIGKLIEFHKSYGKLLTMTCVRPPARFGTMSFEGDLISKFEEKPQTGEGWINGGFFVCEPGIFDYLGDDTTILEREPLERLAKEGELMGYRHEGFWKCMDTLRDKIVLNEMWKSGGAKW